MSSVTSPPSRPNFPSDPDLSQGVRVSIIAHVVFAIAIFVKATVFPGNAVPILPTLRVDVVGLPDILKKDLAHVNKAPTSPSANNHDLADALKSAESEARHVKTTKIPIAKAPVETAAPDEMVLKPKISKASPSDSRAAKAQEQAHEKQMKNALARIKALAKINGEQEVKSTPTAAVVKGNAVSKGTSLSGDAKESAVASYYDSVRDALQGNWALPVWLARQKYQAQVKIFIDASGRLLSFQIMRASGNAQFDEAVKRTVQASSPFQPPPAELMRSVSSDGILVGFPL